MLMETIRMTHALDPTEVCRSAIRNRSRIAIDQARPATAWPATLDRRGGLRRLAAALVV